MWSLVRVAISGLLLALAPGGSSVAQEARDMTLTVYHDGRTCPGNCDSHVVFHRAHNGTANAFAPSSSRDSPRACVVGQACTICFDAAGTSCLTATYRGSGPPRGAFDVTPAFMAEQCGRPDLPPGPVSRKCADIRRATAAASLGVNCIANPDHRGCGPILEAARRKREADLPDYNACKAGPAAFNASVPAERRRKNDCAYEVVSTGRNSKGATWTRLLPGACHPDSFVGRDGLDCCGTDDAANVAFGRWECTSFYVPR